MIKYKYFRPVKGKEAIDKYEKWRVENPEAEILSFDLQIIILYKTVDKPVDNKGDK